MKVTKTEIPEVLIIEPKIFSDSRGLFCETYNMKAYESEAGIKEEFVQDNYSKSVKNVLRGLHYQIKQTQGKLVRVIAGEVFDVAVDIRKSSRTFGKWVGVFLSEKNMRQLWVPPGFAHGYVVLSDCAEFTYKATDYYAPNHERCIKWDDPDLAINWQVNDGLMLSPKDQLGKPFKEAEIFP